MINSRFKRKEPEINEAVVCGLGVKLTVCDDGGVVVKTSSRGYGGKIKVVGISPENQIGKNQFL